MKLSIIIVNYNSGRLTHTCVESIIKQGLPFAYEILVVDNASTDESVSLLKSDWPEIEVISNPVNMGLAAGVNFGLKQAKGQYVLILNPDIVVLPKAIEKMVDFMERNDQIGLLGGKLLSPNGKLQYSCYRFYKIMTIIYRRTWLGKTERGRAAVRAFLMKDYDHETPREVDWLMGACLMARKKALAEVGGMDEKFFLYFEDVDWCRRFWEKRWKVVYLPQAVFSHFHQRSSEHGGLWGLVTNWIVREHIWSAIKYFWKYRGKRIPHNG